MSDVDDLVGRHQVWIVKLLMIAERTLSGLVRPEKIEEMDEELTKVIEDFDRAVNVEALRLAKETSKQTLETSKQTLETSKQTLETSKQPLFSNRRWPNLNRVV